MCGIVTDIGYSGVKIGYLLLRLLPVLSPFDLTRKLALQPFQSEVVTTIGF